MRTKLFALHLLALTLATLALHAAQLAIAPLTRTTSVNFETEILPFLKQNCLACHNQTKAKADLILETPQSILKGGESGPAVVPGKPAESLLLEVASHKNKPFMPPADNKVNASDLTPDQLGLLKLWVEQGATGEVHGAHSIAWRSLPDKVRPILSLAVTEDGQFAACGRGNELVLYQLPTGRTIGPLVDPDLIKSGSAHSNAAHLDLVESLDFSPDGELLASGSYREVKLWRRQHKISRELPPHTTEQKPNGVPVIASSAEAKLLATAGENSIRLWNLESQKLMRELRGDYLTTYRVNQLERALARSKNYLAYRKSSVEAAEKERQTQVERVRKASDAVGLAQKAATDQQAQVSAAKTEETAAEKELAALQAKLKEAQARTDQLKSDFDKMKAALKAADRDAVTAKLDAFATLSADLALATNAFPQLKADAEKNEKATQEKIKATQKRIADHEALLKRMQLTNSATENELHFAITAAQNTFDTLTLAQNNLQLADSDLKQNEMQWQAARTVFTNSFNVTRALAFSPDGKTLATLSDQNKLTLWAVETAAPLETISLPFTAESVSFDGANTVVLSGAARGTALELSPLWKLERIIATSDGQPAFADRVNAIRFSPDGQYLATGGGEPSRSGEVKIWRVRDGQLVQEFKSLHSDTVLSLAYSPDGRYLASGAADRFAKITELATGKTLRVLEGHTHHVLALAWKSDGHTVVTGGADNLIKVWDAFSGEKKKGPEALTKEVTALAYANDDLLAASADSNLRLIKENGEKIRSLEGASGYLQTALATADARYILAGGQDGVLRVWQSDSSKPIAEYK